MSKQQKKQSFHYDSDDGLLEEIEKLTAPPGTKPVRAENTIISQKNWKSVNTQYCIVCREGGELLCCDTCPASFHLMCHQPVIYRDEIPDGKWMCNRCANTPAEMMQTLEEIDETETEEERNRRAALRVIESASEACNDPLSILAQAALAVNAQNFELPSEYERYNLPFDYTKKPKKNTFGKRCRICRSVIENSAITDCDFCNASYHLDCLRPPLCSQPKGKWMCPNHTEHVVDQKLLKSTSVIQRHELWKEYAQQKIDDIGITRNFIGKTKKLGREPRRVRKIKVNGAVKNWYKRRFDVGDGRLEFATENERSEWVDMLVRMHTCDGKSAARSIEQDVIDTVNALLDRLDNTDFVSTGSLENGAVKNDMTEIKQEEVEEDVKNIENHHSTDLLSDCIQRLKNTTSETERAILNLAIERLEQLHNKAVADRQKRQQSLPQSTFNQRNFISDQPVLAVIKSEGDFLPIAIQRAVTTVGTSSNCHVMLEAVSPCGRFCPVQAPNHAAIVFDKIKRQFELIPTGCHQVTVDGVLYGISPTTPRCSCTSDLVPVSQSASLRHGSSISIGCSKFVFATFY